MLTPDRKKTLAAAALLFAAAVGVGAYGGAIVRDGGYMERERDSRRDTRTREIRGPEAISWGWTLVAGAIATLAWAAMLAVPPLPRPKFFHFSCVGTAFAGIAAVVVLRMPPTGLAGNPRACAFYASGGFLIGAAGLLALFKERGVPLVGVALAAGLGAALYYWGLKGLEGMVLCVGAMMLLGLHIAAYVVLLRMPDTPA